VTDWVHVRHEECCWPFGGRWRSANHGAALGIRCGLVRAGAIFHHHQRPFDSHIAAARRSGHAAQISSAWIGGGYFQDTPPQDFFRHASPLIANCVAKEEDDTGRCPMVWENAIRAAVAGVVWAVSVNRPRHIAPFF